MLIICGYCKRAFNALTNRPRRFCSTYCKHSWQKEQRKLQTKINKQWRKEVNE